LANLDSNEAFSSPKRLRKTVERTLFETDRAKSFLSVLSAAEFATDDWKDVPQELKSLRENDHHESSPAEPALSLSNGDG
jgi:hypothetical protein